MRLKNFTGAHLVLLHPSAVDEDISERGALRAREGVELPRLFVLPPDGRATVVAACVEPAGSVTVERPGRLFAPRVPLCKAKSPEGPAGLPEPEADVGVVVTAEVAAAAAAAGLSHRDLLTPHEPVRNSCGAVVGYLSLRLVTGEVAP